MRWTQATKSEAVVITVTIEEATLTDRSDASDPLSQLARASSIGRRNVDLPRKKGSRLWLGGFASS